MTNGWLSEQPVDSTRGTSAWLGLIAMLQGQNGAKRGEGAAIILYENDAEGVEAVIWRECDVQGGRDRDSRETWGEGLVVVPKPENES